MIRIPERIPVWRTAVRVSRLLWLVVLSVAVPAGCHSTLRPAATPGQPVHTSTDPFRDVTRDAGLTYRLEPARRPMRILESFGSGCAFLDADGDGRLDLLLVGTPRSALYRNQGSGRFSDVTQAAGLDQEGTWIGCAVGDYDNDGDPDLFLTGYQSCALYENLGKGTFRDVTASSGIRTNAWNTAAAFSDLDGDGLLDLYVGAYAEFGPHTKQYCALKGDGILTSCRPIDYDPVRGRGYRGLGNGQFADVTRAWGLDAAHGRTLGVAPGDFNRDGWTDLYLANDEIEADLFQNLGGRGFKNVSVSTGTAYGPNSEVMGGMGVDWGDYNRDGWPDLLVGTYEAEPKPLFRSLGGKAFEAVSSATQNAADAYSWVVWGSLLLDYDNDGWLDVLYVNGHVWDNVHQVQPNSAYRQPGALFRNQGGERFTPVISAALSRPGAYRGLACGDYDDDGDPDLLVQDIDGAARLLRNELALGANALRLQLEGTRANRDGYGAVVTITAGGVRRTAEARTARSYLSACEPRVSFGLGSATRAEHVEVRWPGGRVTRMRNVSTGSTVPAREQ
jgi:enediyne biosynthesis protein E4